MRAPFIFSLACASSFLAHHQRNFGADTSTVGAAQICPFDGDCGPNCMGTQYGGRSVPLPVREFLKRSPRKVMYSFGVGEDISFDVAFACKFQFQVKLYDPSPSAKEHFEYVAAVVGKSHADDSQDRLHPVAGTRASDTATYWHKVRMTPIQSSAFEMHDIGVGTQDGDLTFYQSKTQGESGSWSLDQGMRGAGGSRSITVPVHTIEHIFGDDRPVAVKLDVEGLENDILPRLLQQGQQAPPVIFVDFDSICCCLGTPAYCAKKKAEGQAMVGQMQAAGYQLFRQHQGGGDYTFWRQPQQ